MGFLRAEGPVAGDVLAAKESDDRRPRAHHARGAGPRRDRAHARDRRVAARRVGDEGAAARGEGGGRHAARARAHGPRVPRPAGARPAGRRDHERRRCRRSGSASRSAAWSRASTQGPSVLVLEGGHPIGVLTRSDVLGFLAVERPRLASAMSADRREPTVSRPARFTSGRSPIRTPARSCRRSAWRRRSRRTRSGSTAATSTRAAATRRAPRWRRASRRSKARATAWGSRAGSRPKTRSCARSIPATTSSFPTDAYGGTFRLVARVHERHGIDWTAADLRDLERARGRVARRDPDRLDRDADQPDALHRRHRGRREGRARTHRRGSSSTTRSRRRTCNSRSRSAPTCRCTRRRSISAVTPMSSAASSR